jgi:hypothetical protein
MVHPLISSLVLTHTLIAASDGLPTIDVAKTCQASTNELIKLFGDTTMISFDSCMRQQSAALEKLKAEWPSYPADDKSRCVQPAVYMPSYVEWLTCLEAAREVRRIRANER